VYDLKKARHLFDGNVRVTLAKPLNKNIISIKRNMNKNAIYSINCRVLFAIIVTTSLGGLAVSITES